MLYESKQELVSLENEVEVLRAYIALHQIKYEQELSIAIDIDEDALKHVLFRLCCSYRYSKTRSNIRE